VLLFELGTKLRFIVDGKEHDEPITIDGKKHDFYVALPAEPEVVRFDPEYTLLAKVDFDKSDKLLEAQLANAEDAMGRVLACDELADVKTQAAVAALKKALNEDAFFGTRCSAATALRKIRTEEAVAALLDSVKQDDARVRKQVVEELGKCYRDEAAKQLLATIESEKNPAIVATALRGLASHQGEAASAAAKDALGDESWGGEPVGAAFAVIRDLNDPSLAVNVMETIKSREVELDPRDVSEAMVTVAKLSQRGKRKETAFKFFVDYLNHPRQTLQASAIRGLGELRHPAARPLLEPIAANKTDAVLAAAAKAALAELDKETPLVPKEVGDLRKEVRELQESQEKLQKKLDEMDAKKKADGKSIEKKDGDRN
jgi:aminopeptidase N